MKVIQGDSKQEPSRMHCKGCSDGGPFKQTTNHTLYKRPMSGSHEGYPITWYLNVWSCDVCDCETSTDQQKNAADIRRLLACADIDFEIEEAKCTLSLVKN